MQRLTDHISWCDCDGMIILLDLAADRYFRLAPKLEPVFRRYVGGDPEAQDADILIGAGVRLDAHGGQGFTAGRALPPAHDDLQPAARAPMHIVIRALRAEARAAWRLRRQGLGRTLLSLRRLHSASIAQDDIAAQVAAGFAASGLVLGTSDRCLVRAIACHDLCAALGCPATLVLGVTAVPFQAHAWVQHRDLVLVGDYSHASAYTPILALP